MWFNIFEYKPSEHGKHFLLLLQYFNDCLVFSSFEQLAPCRTTIENHIFLFIYILNPNLTSSDETTPTKTKLFATKAGTSTS